MAKVKLNQILAVEKGAKAKSNGFTDIYQLLSKTDLLNGLTKTYTPVKDEDHVYPGESKIVQLRVSDAIDKAKASMVDLFDVTATKDYGNTVAKADIVIDGKVLLPGVPVTYLLFLEKRLVDLATFVSKLPTLAPDTEWTLNSQNGLYQSDKIQTTKTKKISTVITLAPATPEHPAQAQLAHEDVPEGTWTTIKSSGCAASTEVAALLSKVEALQKAVKMAREEANSVEVEQVKVADTIFNYVFGK